MTSTLNRPLGDLSPRDRAAGLNVLNESCPDFILPGHGEGDETNRLPACPCCPAVR